MQFINGVYAQRSNRRYQQTGHVFEARFRSLVIQRESYLLSRRTLYRPQSRAGKMGPGAGRLVVEQLSCDGGAEVAAGLAQC